MFVGHYGVGFAAKSAEPTIPLWVVFLAVQFLDILGPLHSPGYREGAHRAGITASNPLDLYYMPYTHSLLAAILWSCVGGCAYQLLARPARANASVVVGLAVFSHWILDFVVHRPDLPLYDDSAKVGLGLWNAPALAFGVEAALLFGGMWLSAPRAPRPLARAARVRARNARNSGLYLLRSAPDLRPIRGLDRAHRICRLCRSDLVAAGSRCPGENRYELAMHVLVTGATGVIGRRVVPMLLAQGHHVTALARNPQSRQQLERLGARCVAVDLFDLEALSALPPAMRRSSIWPPTCLPPPGRCCSAAPGD